MLSCRCPFPFPVGKRSGRRQLKADRAWSCPHLMGYHSSLMNGFIILWGVEIFSRSPFRGKHIPLLGPPIHFGAMGQREKFTVFPQSWKK